MNEGPVAGDAKTGENAVSHYVALGAAGIVISAVVLLVLLKVSPNACAPKWDETLYVYDAQRVLSGQVPYRDFFNFTPPGTFLLQAVWYGLWGGKATLTLGRYLAALVALLSWLSLWRTLKRAGWSARDSLLLSALFPTALYVFWPIPSHHWFAILCLFLSFEAWDFERKRVRGFGGWLWIGLTGGAAAVFLQTIGLYALLFWGIQWLLGQEKKLSGLFAALGGGALVLCPVLGWIWTNGALTDFYSDTFLWTMRNYGSPGGPNSVRLLGDLPSRLTALWTGAPGYPKWEWVPFSIAGTILYTIVLVIFLLCLLLAMRSLFQSFRSRGLPSATVSAAMVVTFVAASLYLKGKTDWIHLVYLAGPVGLAWCAAHGPRGELKPRRSRTFFRLLAVSLAACLFFQSGYLVFHRIHAWEFTDVDRPVRDAPVNEYLRSRTWLKQGDTIVALPEGGQVYLYTRPAAMGYTLLAPLSYHYNTLRDHEIAVMQMEKERPRCVVMTIDTEKAYMDPRSPLGRLIRRDFRRFARVKDAVVYLRRKGR